ncbi:MAG: hypothetical protein ACEQSA_02415 [Weeksellaceae bacterium]
MLIEKKFDEKLQKVIKLKNPVEGKLWADVIIYSIVILLLVCGYYFARRSTFDLQLFNRTLADTGMLLIGISFALSSICYFWNFADSFIIYRKHFGLVGFTYVAAHVIISVALLPEFYAFPAYYLKPENIMSFIAALAAFIVLTMMALISNKYAIQKLGGVLWKKLLSLGFLAYVLTLIHYGTKVYVYWIRWFTGTSEIKSALPPFSLLVTLFAITILSLRLALSIHLSLKKKTALTDENI